MQRETKFFQSLTLIRSQHPGLIQSQGQNARSQFGAPQVLGTQIPTPSPAVSRMHICRRVRWMQSGQDSDQPSGWMQSPKVQLGTVPYDCLMPFLQHGHLINTSSTHGFREWFCAKINLAFNSIFSMTFLKCPGTFIPLYREIYEVTYCARVSSVQLTLPRGTPSRSHSMILVFIKQLTFISTHHR